MENEAGLPGVPEADAAVPEIVTHDNALPVVSNSPQPVVDDYDIGPMPEFMIRREVALKGAPTIPGDRIPETKRVTYVMPDAPVRTGPTRAELDAQAMHVARVVRKGADTMGKIRKGIGKDDGINRAVRRAIRMGLVAREGKRYYAR